jgi:hypothetical protein
MQTGVWQAVSGSNGRPVNGSAAGVESRAEGNAVAVRWGSARDTPLAVDARLMTARTAIVDVNCM